MARELLWRALSPAPEITEALGEALGRRLVAGSLVALVGELGGGKTTLVRGLARGLGVEDPVVSPTFTRMRALAGRLPLFHFDAWRGGAGDLFEEGAEFLSGEGVAVVEWADRVEEALPRPRAELRLLHHTPEERVLEACLWRDEEAGPAGQALADSLSRALEAAGATPGLRDLVTP